MLEMDVEALQFQRSLHGMLGKNWNFSCNFFGMLRKSQKKKKKNLLHLLCFRLLLRNGENFVCVKKG